MSSDTIETFIIEGEEIAAHSMYAAKMAHRVIKQERERKQKEKADRLERDAYLKRTQPYNNG